MVGDFPLHRFEEFGALDRGEREALQALGNPPRTYRKGALIRDEGVTASGFYLLVRGWVAASHILPNGSRQILKLHLPGDALGTPSMCTVRTVEQLTSLTEAVVIPVPLQRFGRLLAEHPAMGARFMLSVQLERLILMDRLASVCRTSGQARLAAFLTDLADRLRPLGLADGDSFEMPITQEHIGDLVGLTSVHTNRSLKSLDELGLIERKGRRVKICDYDRLAALGVRPKRERRVDADWLPARQIRLPEECRV